VSFHHEDCSFVVSTLGVATLDALTRELLHWMFRQRLDLLWGKAGIVLGGLGWAWAVVWCWFCFALILVELWTGAGGGRG